MRRAYGVAVDVRRGSGCLSGPEVERCLPPMSEQERHMEQPTSSLIRWTEIIYALHAFSLLTGILGAATVVGAFLTGWPSIIAVILNYVKRSDTRGTWLESH